MREMKIFSAEMVNSIAFYSKEEESFDAYLGNFLDTNMHVLASVLARTGSIWLTAEISLVSRVSGMGSSLTRAHESETSSISQLVSDYCYESKNMFRRVRSEARFENCSTRILEERILQIVFQCFNGCTSLGSSLHSFGKICFPNVSFR